MQLVTVERGSQKLVRRSSTTFSSRTGLVSSRKAGNETYLQRDERLFGAAVGQQVEKCANHRPVTNSPVF